MRREREWRVGVNGDGGSSREEVTQMTEMGLRFCDNDVCVRCLQMSIQRCYSIGFFPILMMALVMRPPHTLTHQVAFDFTLLPPQSLLPSSPTPLDTILYHRW